MTQYILTISSYAGIVPWAVHYKGVVKGPHPPSCHGGTTYHGSDGPLRGKTTCSEGHELPKQAEWQVEAAWTEERYSRYAAGHFEGDSPSVFTDKREVMDCAIIRFLDGADQWWEQKVPPAEEGDELWYGWIGDREADAELQDPEDGWGMMIARKCTS